MNTQQVVDLAVQAGCEVIDYGDHYCIKQTVEVSLVITVPNVTHLAVKVVEKIKELLCLE